MTTITMRLSLFIDSPMACHSMMSQDDVTATLQDSRTMVKRRSPWRVTVPFEHRREDEGNWLPGVSAHSPLLWLDIPIRITGGWWCDKRIEVMD